MTKLSAAETLAVSRLKSVNLTLPAVAMSGIGTGTVSTFVFGVSSVWARLPKPTWIYAGWMWGRDTSDHGACLVDELIPVRSGGATGDAIGARGDNDPGWEGDHTHRVPHTPHRAHDAGRPVRRPRDREAGVHDWRVGDRGQRH